MRGLSVKVVLAALALVVVPAAIAAVVVHQGSGRSSGVARHARLQPAGTSPLRVKGTGFVPGERVRLKVSAGTRKLGRNATARTGGSFVATFLDLDACDSVTITAVGSKGSRASFNLSQIACLGP